MTPDQTAPKGAVLSGFILIAIEALKLHQQMRKRVNCHELPEISLPNHVVATQNDHFSEY